MVRRPAGTGRDDPVSGPPATGSLATGAREALDEQKIGVLLVDDNEAFRASMRALLQSHRDLRVVGETGDAICALRLVAERAPDVVLIDVIMPRHSGIATSRRILAAHPAVKVIGLSLHAEARLVAAMQSAGASGYVLKDRAFEDLVDAIGTVTAGGTFFRTTNSEVGNTD